LKLNFEGGARKKKIRKSFTNANQPAGTFLETRTRNLRTASDLVHFVRRASVIFPGRSEWIQWISGILCMKPRGRPNKRGGLGMGPPGPCANVPVACDGRVGSWPPSRGPPCLFGPPNSTGEPVGGGGGGPPAGNPRIPLQLGAAPAIEACFRRKWELIPGHCPTGTSGPA